MVFTLINNKVLYPRNYLRQSTPGISENRKNGEHFLGYITRKLQFY